MNGDAKAKELRQEIEAMSTEESQLRGRILQIKQMVEEKKRRAAALEQLKKEEAELLELLK